MRKILYINCSPRNEKISTSAVVLRDLGNFLKEEVAIFTLPRIIQEEKESVLATLDSFDIWIIAFPLYVDVLPGHLTWWLKEYENYRKENGIAKNIKVYGIANCGFPEPEQNREALNIMEIFCRKNGLEWRFGIGLGMGEPYKQMKNIPIQSKNKKEILGAFKRVEEDLKNIDSSNKGNSFVSVKFPKSLYKLMGSLGWVLQARKNGLKRSDLYARPLFER